MADTIKSEVHVALIHYPVYNKIGEVVTSSVTTLDIHDISRVARTYAVSSFFVVTPLKRQRELVERLIEHWMTGYGAEYNPTRKEALLVTRVKNNITETVRDLTEKYGRKPIIVATCAKKNPESVDFQNIRKEILNDHAPSDTKEIIKAGPFSSFSHPLFFVFVRRDRIPPSPFP